MLKLRFRIRAVYSRECRAVRTALRRGRIRVCHCASLEELGIDNTTNELEPLQSDPHASTPCTVEQKAHSPRFNISSGVVRRRMGYWICTSPGDCRVRPSKEDHRRGEVEAEEP